MFEFLTLDWVFNVIITVGIAVAFVYFMFRETGIEAKLKRIKNQQINQINSGWGVEELKKLTNMRIKELMELSEKVNKKVLLGIKEIGTAKMRIKINENRYIYEISKGFLGAGKKLYFIVDTNEVSHIDKKNIFLKDDVVNNKAGIYYLVGNNKRELENKTTFIDSVITRMNNEDISGRISNFATKISYLDIVHAQQSDLLMKRIEAMNKQNENGGNNTSVMDFLSA